MQENLKKIRKKQTFCCVFARGQRKNQIVYLIKVLN